MWLRAYRINLGGNVAALILGLCLCLVLSPVLLIYAAYVGLNRLGRPQTAPAPLFLPPLH